jgi:hypothetical protein
LKVELVLSARLSVDVCLISAIMIVVLPAVTIDLAAYSKCAVYKLRVRRVNFFFREHEIQFRSIWTIFRELMVILAKVTLLQNCQ